MPTRTNNYTPLQPDISAASLMRLPSVMAATGLARSTVWHKARCGAFPVPIRFGRVTAWRSADVANWLSNPAAWRADNTTTGEACHA